MKKIKGSDYAAEEKLYELNDAAEAKLYVLNSLSKNKSLSGIISVGR